MQFPPILFLKKKQASKQANKKQPTIQPPPPKTSQIPILSLTVIVPHFSGALIENLLLSPI